MVIIRFF